MYFLTSELLIFLGPQLLLFILISIIWPHLNPTIGFEDDLETDVSEDDYDYDEQNGEGDEGSSRSSSEPQKTNWIIPVVIALEGFLQDQLGILQESGKIPSIVVARSSKIFRACQQGN